MGDAEQSLNENGSLGYIYLVPAELAATLTAAARSVAEERPDVRRWEAWVRDLPVWIVRERSIPGVGRAHRENLARIEVVRQFDEIHPLVTVSPDAYEDEPQSDAASFTRLFADADDTLRARRVISAYSLMKESASNTSLRSNIEQVLEVARQLELRDRRRIEYPSPYTARSA